MTTLNFAKHVLPGSFLVCFPSLTKFGVRLVTISEIATRKAQLLLNSYCNWWKLLEIVPGRNIITSHNTIDIEFSSCRPTFLITQAICYSSVYYKLFNQPTSHTDFNCQIKMCIDFPLHNMCIGVEQEVHTIVSLPNLSIHSWSVDITALSLSEI